MAGWQFGCWRLQRPHMEQKVFIIYWEWTDYGMVRREELFLRTLGRRHAMLEQLLASSWNAFRRWLCMSAYEIEGNSIPETSQECHTGNNEKCLSELIHFHQEFYLSEKSERNSFSYTIHVSTAVPVRWEFSVSLYHNCMARITVMGVEFKVAFNEYVH